MDNVQTPPYVNLSNPLHTQTWENYFKERRCKNDCLYLVTNPVKNNDTLAFLINQCSNQLAEMWYLMAGLQEMFPEKEIGDTVIHVFDVTNKGKIRKYQGSFYNEWKDDNWYPIYGDSSLKTLPWRHLKTC